MLLFRAVSSEMEDFNNVIVILLLKNWKWLAVLGYIPYGMEEA